LLDANLRAGRSGDEHAAQLLDVVAKIAVVPDVDRIAFAALDVFRDHFTADPRTDRLLDIGNGQAVAGSFEPVDLDVDVKACDTRSAKMERTSGIEESTCWICAPAC